LETETLLPLQKFGHFPQDLNICIEWNHWCTYRIIMW
jgi:hypothetical protein